MTLQTLQEHFPDLSIMEFKVLGTIAYHGEIPAKYHLRSLAHKSRYREEDVMEAVEKLRRSQYISDGRVNPKYFFPVVDFIMKNTPQWENTFAWMQTFRYDFSAYIWDLCKLISQENYAAAVALKRPVTSTYSNREKAMRLERYLACIIDTKEGETLARLLIKDEVDALVTYLLEDKLRENLLSVEEIEKIKQIIYRAGMCLEDYEDQLELYRFFVQGGEPMPKRKPKKNQIRIAPPSVWSLAWKAVNKLYANDLIGSLDLFTAALGEHDKQSQVKGSFDNRILSFFYAICLLRCELASTLSDNRLTEIKEKFLRSRNVYYGRELAATRILLTYATSQHPNCSAFVKKEVDKMVEEDDCPLTHIFADILRGYFKCNDCDLLCDIPSVGILKYELSSFRPIGSVEKKALADAFGGPAQLPQIRRKDDWEIVFSDVRRNILESKKAERRIVYFLDGLWLNNIIEQTKQPDGTWDNGISLSRKQFMNEGYDSMTESDRKIAAQMRVRSVEVPEAGIIFHELCGSDKIFVGQPFNSPFEPAIVQTELPKIHFKVSGENILITSNVPFDNSLIYKCIPRVISHGHYSAIMLNDLQKDILQRMLSTSTLPLHAIEEVKLLAERLNGIIEVESDLDFKGDIPTVEGSGKIAVRITPDDESKGYQLKILAAPYPEGEVRYPAGDGEEIVYDQSEGKTVIIKRNLEAEQENYERVHDFIFDNIGDVFQDFMTAHISTAESLLKLLQYTFEHQECYITEWPRGRELKFRGVMKPADVEIQVKTDIEWFKVDGRVHIPGSTLSYMELLKKYRNTEFEDYICIGENEYMKMTDTLKKHIESMNDLLADHDKQSKSGLVGKYDVGNLAMILGENGGLHAEMDEDFIGLLRRMQNAYQTTPAVPEGLNASLREYQREGFEWMARLSEWGAGACLADDMGLGKTVQTIALLLYRADKGASLVVAPKSLILNWEGELKKFAPSLRPVTINNEKNKKEALERAGAGDVVITTYGVLVTQKEALSNKNWNVICLDEAHYIKNRMTRTSRAAMSLKGDARIALTGTPIQNHLGEMWNLFQFMNPGMLGPWTQFIDKYIKAPADDVVYQELKDKTVPFILRRTKEEVLTDLPDKISYEQLVELSPEELQIYEKIRRDVEIKFKKHKTKEERKEAKKLDLSFFQELTKLRLLANSVSLVYPEWKPESSKIAALRDILTSLESTSSNRVLIFSQFTSFLSQIGNMMKEAGMDYLYLDGQTPMDERQRLVDDFQNGQSPFFLISLKAGGLGLNLTAANYVILMDPWWNPSIEDQATDRAHRIGQERNVTVVRLVSANTIEEKILKLHEMKQDISDRVLEGTGNSAALTMEEILDMVSPYR